MSFSTNGTVCDYYFFELRVNLIASVANKSRFRYVPARDTLSIHLSQCQYWGDLYKDGAEQFWTFPFQRDGYEWVCWGRIHFRDREIKWLSSLSLSGVWGALCMELVPSSKRGLSYHVIKGGVWLWVTRITLAERVWWHSEDVLA